MHEDDPPGGRGLGYPSPDLADATVRLRPWRETDLACVRAAGTDPSIPAGTTVPAEYTPDAGLAFIHRRWGRCDDREGISLAVTDRGTDEALGLLALLHQPQPLVVNLGYWVVPAARRRGLAGAAVRLASDWVLTATDTVRVQAWVRVGNEPSLRTLRRAGFATEGVLRRFLGAEEQDDAVVLSRVRPVTRPGRPDT